MTSVSFCNKCTNLKFSLNENRKVKSEGEVGFKSSCCGKCSNVDCVDHGVCDCFEFQLEHMSELLQKRLAEGWVPDDVGTFE